MSPAATNDFFVKKIMAEPFVSAWKGVMRGFSFCIGGGGVPERSSTGNKVSAAGTSFNWKTHIKTNLSLLFHVFGSF
jgi:hypothetical protein